MHITEELFVHPYSMVNVWNFYIYGYMDLSMGNFKNTFTWIPSQGFTYGASGKEPAGQCRR